MADEYDDIPDAFEGIDFDQIPELSVVQETEDKSDYEDFFDDIDPTALDGVPHLGPVQPNDSASIAGNIVGALANNSPQGFAREFLPGSSGTQAPSLASTQYAFDEVDDAFLRRVSEIEQTVSVTQSSTPSADRPLSYSRSQRQERMERRISGPAATSQMSRRSKQGKKEPEGKPVGDPHASARQILARLEEELTCPICYDFLVATHTTAPCGHSCCGECLLTYLKGVGRKATCPVCRAALTRARPLIPTFTLDNMVQKHVEALEQTGSVDWQPFAQRRRDFAERKAQSSKVTEDISRFKLPPPLPINPPHQANELDDFLDYMGETDDDSEYED
ncbi:hypothetical protein BN946_scf184942.g66 [Trametes cinnabarina]|uniref:RING-type domain-containing protein n=1 Tax=Pycnoporus cinnabarinus TaxID=5643 RepID=A0A060S7P7_PYCCI|nr:hypothetical protein BN946_scf184942.g66 [Trametes cinnabarina]